MEAQGIRRIGLMKKALRAIKMMIYTKKRETQKRALKCGERKCSEKVSSLQLKTMTSISTSMSILLRTGWIRRTFGEQGSRHFRHISIVLLFNCVFAKVLVRFFHSLKRLLCPRQRAFIRM